MEDGYGEGESGLESPYYGNRGLETDSVLPAFLSVEKVKHFVHPRKDHGDYFCRACIISSSEFLSEPFPHLLAGKALE